MPSLLETLSFVTGLICVWLAVRQNVWNFPVGLVNVATFCVVFFQARLYADAALQVVYFVLAVIGWYLWLYGGADKTRLKVSRATHRELLGAIAAAGLLTIILSQLLERVGGSATHVDALTTSLSLCAQWLLNRKLLENWVIWLVTDTIYVPLYIYKQLYLTAGLYVVFLGLAIAGFFEWRRSLLADSEAA